MRLNLHILKLCDELFAKISETEKERNSAAGIAIENLYAYLSDDPENLEEEDQPGMIVEVKSQLDSVVKLISEEEKCKNNAFMKQLDELTEHLDLLYEEKTSEDGDLYESEDYLEEVDWDDSENEEDSYEMDEDFGEEDVEWD